MEKFFTYIIESEIDGSYYYGYTSNLEERIRKHNSGMSKYTSKKLPWKLIYYKEFNSKSLFLADEEESWISLT